jgi:hypothetical protein
MSRDYDICDPLTCRRCNPEPWAQAEVGVGKIRRRFTGWRAVAVTVGPFVLSGFWLGLLTGVLLMVVTR